jgi:tetratricopeptide (TPR) repeat protein
MNQLRLWLLIVAPILVAVSLTSLWWATGSTPETSAPHWVGESDCQQCHQPQFQDWRDSHHQLAMLPPTDSSVLADFDDATLRSDRETTAFFRKGEEFWVRAPDATGTPREFQVAYTFGWEPLQQYLLVLDDGRLQALGAAWDTEQERWFHLYDGQGVDAHHPLHWSQPAQNANTQCIDCHTTGFQLGYDEATGAFDSQWQNLGVGCQACHGPASGHLSWVDSPSDDPLKGFARQLNDGSQQLETCARCHSRRTPLGDPAQAQSLDDAYRVSSLMADLYQVDGKILDEVFEHGSFLQSRMHQAGVVCSDCHNPHSGGLRAEGNGVCSQCHNPAGQPIRAAIASEHLAAGDYDSPAHHHHTPGSAGAACRDCHMPGKVYMGNDLRHDHSFSSPDPAQALALDHSDACLGCHAEKPAEALIAQFQQWYPGHQPRDGGYARALFKARQAQPGAAEALLTQLARDDLPNLRRAALVAELPNYPSRAAEQWLVQALGHEDVSVRRAAIDGAAGILEPHELQTRLTALLEDPVRTVRLTAAEQLLMLADQYGAPLSPDLFQEYEQVQLQLLANAQAHFNLANIYRLTDRTERVEASLQAALQRNPAFSPAGIALAQWLDGSSPGSGLRLLEERLRDYPDDADLHHALGLAKIRARRIPEGVSALARARTLAPENDTYAYVLAVAWHDTGQQDRAVQLLRRQLQRHPASRSIRLALLAYLQAGEGRQTLMNELKQLNPQDPAL